MKKAILSTLFFLAVTFFVKAQESTEPKKDNPNASEITFESDVYDYGTIKQGADGNCEFKFKNTGKEPLVISNA